jgi:hypothetical protein
MNKIKLHRKYLALGHDKNLPNPLSQEHEWLFQLINNYDLQSKQDIYKCITINTDYYKVRQQFMINILAECNTYYDIKKFKNIHNSIQDIIELWQKDMLQKEVKKWSAARLAAESAAESTAWSAARLAAESAAESTAESTAWSAAWSAARLAAESTAWSAAEEKQVLLIISLIKEYS